VRLSLLRDCVEHRRDLEGVLKTMEDSGLRGLGGAGFSEGRKWRIVRAEAAPRIMAVNIDEGEPGTFKDRVYLERDPHRFLEGMLIASWAVAFRLFISTCAMSITAAVRCSKPSLPSCKRIRRCRCPKSSCGAVRVPTFAAKSRR